MTRRSLPAFVMYFQIIQLLETIGIVLVVVALIAVGVFSWKWENSGSDDFKRTQTKDEHKEA